MKKDWMIKESQLDDIQNRILWATFERSCVVAGCAGSGKSVLALIKAQRIQKECPNNSSQVIVFTKALCRYMNAGRAELGLKNDFLYHWQWKSQQGMPSADYVIVDEIQDFSKDEIQEFMAATKKQFFFFGDTAQSIYNGIPCNGVKKVTVPVDDIPGLAPDRFKVRKMDLYNNYRLPIPMARLAQQVGVDLDPFDELAYKSEEHEKPRIIDYPSQEEQVQAIHRIIAANNFSNVGILLPKNEDVQRIGGMLQELGGNYEMKYRSNGEFDNLDFDSTNPKVMTYHSAKGLQFEAVFLPFLEKFDKDERPGQKALYVAMTRTYRHLYMLHSGPMKAPLASLNPEYFKTVEKDEMEII